MRVQCSITHFILISYKKYSVGQQILFSETMRLTTVKYTIQPHINRSNDTLTQHTLSPTFFLSFILGHIIVSLAFCFQLITIYPSFWVRDYNSKPYNMMDNLAITFSQCLFRDGTAKKNIYFFLNLMLHMFGTEALLVTHSNIMK